MFIAHAIKNVSTAKPYQVAADFILALNHSCQKFAKKDRNKKMSTIKKIISYRYLMYEVHSNVLNFETHTT